MSQVAVRRTQEERSAKTRALLLDAAIECLFDLGFAGTTTTVVCDRAGVSRGAQLHHFPTKAALVTEAVAHLFERRVAEFRTAFAKCAKDEGGAERAVTAVNLLWSIMSGPSFYAWLEVTVAARTDSKLREAVARISQNFAELVRATYRELFPDRAGLSPIGEIAPMATFALMQGLALDLIVMPHRAESEKVLDAWRALSRLTMLAPPTGGQP